MVYIGVEFRDNFRGRTREFWALVPYEQTNSDDEIPFDPMLCDEFDQWVEDGVDPEWTDEQKEGYYEICDWVWWYLDDEEIKMYEERSCRPIGRNSARRRNAYGSSDRNIIADMKQENWNKMDKLDVYEWIIDTYH